MSDREMIEKIRAAAHANDTRHISEIAHMAMARAGGGMRVADTSHAYLRGVVTPALLERILDELVYLYCYQKRMFVFTDVRNGERLFSVGVYDRETWHAGGGVAVPLSNVHGWESRLDHLWVCSVRANARRIARENGLGFGGPFRTTYSRHDSPNEQVSRTRAALAYAYNQAIPRVNEWDPSERATRNGHRRVLDEAFGDWTEAARARVYLQAHLDLHPREAR